MHRIEAVDARLLGDLIAGGSVLAFPSLDDGFGLPPLEAMIAGVPVVATAAGALPELVGDLVEPGDDDGFGAALTTAGSSVGHSG